MKAHIVGGGFGGLAAAAYLVRDAGMSGQDITVYEADDRLGGAFSLAGDAATGYILPTGAVFDAEFRCRAVRPSSRQSPRWAIRRFPSRTISSPSTDPLPVLRTLGTHHRPGLVRIMHGPHFGLSMRDQRSILCGYALTPEAMLDGRRIDEFFRADFFATEFWLLLDDNHGAAAAAQCDGDAALHAQTASYPCCRTCRSCRTSCARASTSTRPSSNLWWRGCARVV